MKKNKSDYEVGYAKPPIKTRFRKGHSGNPIGRPKGSKNLATILEREMNLPVVINENGRRRIITKLEAGIKQLVNKAATGDQRSMQQVIAIHPLLDQSGTNANLQTSESDQKVIDGIIKRMTRATKGKPNELQNK